MSKLASVLEKQGSYLAAKENFHQVVELWRKICRPGHLDTVMAMSKLVIVLYGQGKDLETEEVESAIEEKKRLYLLSSQTY